MSKLFEVIKSLPDEPERKIIWVAYNSNMALGAANLMKLIKGEDYVDSVIFVSRDELDPNLEGDIYYSPDLYDHIGNGAN